MTLFSMLLIVLCLFTRDKLLIAPYGFDCIKWNPSEDKFLPAKYSANNIEGKAVCKVALRHHLGFSKPSFAIVRHSITFVLNL